MRIFGFDIGTTSIGWAVIEYDAETAIGRILGMGARIFPEARDPDGTPLNQNRRQKRLVRRQLRRRKRRRRALNELLASAGLLPPFAKGKRVNGEYEQSPWEQVMALQPLELRKKGVPGKLGEAAEKLEPHELGRALYHLARLRHFKGRDLEETEASEEESAEEKKAKSDRDVTIQALRVSGRTLGQMLADRAPVQGKKGGTHRIKGTVPKQQTRRIHALRAHIDDEFKRLVEAQKQFHPALNDPAFVGGLHETIFAQKPVFWRKSTLGKCRFIPDAPLCPKGSWLSQQKRMLEKLNNLTVVGGNLRPLNHEERAAILEKLQTQTSMSWAGVRAALKSLYKKRGEPGEEKSLRFNLEIGGETALLGNAVEAKLAGIFGDVWTGHPHQQAIRDSIHERLWQADYGEIGTQRVVILSESDRRERRSKVVESLIHDFGVSAVEAKALADLPAGSGWEPYSIEALKRFLFPLEEGVCFGALVNGPEWAEWRDEEFPDREQPTGEILDRLPSPKDREEQKRLAALRNPTVIRVQNELRKVVNNLISVWGKPDRIRVELTREVGKSKRERELDKKRIGDSRKKREIAVKDLQSNGIDQPSLRDIDKWILWKESGQRCPYTGDHIGFDQLFGQTGEFDIEHIWPRELSIEPGMGNLTLCRRDVNIKKGKRTPFEAFRNTPEWDDMRRRIWKWVKDGKFPESKAKRFCREEPLDDGFRQRQLNDTGYAARQVVTSLKRLWPDVGQEAPVNVQAVSGRVTAQLRRLWKLNNILSDDGEKTRADHRHHAIDALTVACADPRVTKALADYWQRKDDPRVVHPHLPPPWDGIRTDVERLKNNNAIRISYRTRKKISGPLHEEMPFGDTGEELTKNNTSFGIYVKRIPVEKLTLPTLQIDHVSKMTKTARFVVRDEAIRRALYIHLEQAGGDPKKAYSTYPHLPSRKLKQENSGEQSPEIRKVRALTLQQKSLMAPVGIKTNGLGQKIATGFSGLENNHHIAIFRLIDNSVDFEIVSLYEATRRLAKREPVVRRTHSNGRFIMSLASGEAIEFLRGDKKGIWIVRGAWSNGQIVLTRETDARPTSKTEAQRLGMDGPREEYRPMASKFLSDGVRKVSIDPIGRIRPAND